MHASRTEAYFLSFCVPTYKGWIAPWDISFRAEVRSMKEWSWKLQQDGILAVRFGQGEENAQECAFRRKALRCALACQLNKWEFCLSEDSNFWNLTNAKLFLRSEQESKARETACSLHKRSLPQSLFLEYPSAINALKYCLFAFNREKTTHYWSELLTGCWDCQQSTGDVQIHKHKRNEKTTIKKQQQQHSNLQKTNNKDIQTSEGSFPVSDRAVTMFHDSEIGYGFKVLP